MRAIPEQLVRVRYSPGFQRDLTSWSYVVSESGKGFEEYEYSAFCGVQDLPGSYRNRFEALEFEHLCGLISAFDSSPVFDWPDIVIDDSEYIGVETSQRSYFGSASTLAWMESRGDLPSGYSASLHPVLRLYQFFRERLHYEAFSGIDCRPFIA